MLERDIRECEESQPRWDAVWQRAVAAKALVDPDRREYYQAAVLTMITINRESNLALLRWPRLCRMTKPATERRRGLRRTRRCRHSMRFRRR